MLGRQKLLLNSRRKGESASAGRAIYLSRVIAIEPLDSACMVSFGQLLLQSPSTSRQNKHLACQVTSAEIRK